MIRAHEIAVDSNDKQATHRALAAGVARYSYDGVLAEWKHPYEAHKCEPSLPQPAQSALRRQANAAKFPEDPWMLEGSKNAPHMAILHLGDAYQRFFKGEARYPTLGKTEVDDRFTWMNDQIAVNGKRVRTANLGWVGTRKSVRFVGRMVSATVSKRADPRFIGSSGEMEDAPNGTGTRVEGTPPEGTRAGSVVHVDLDVATFATPSTGKSVPGLKPHETVSNRQRRLVRSLARTRTERHNHAKAKRTLARLHGRMANIRPDATHDLTTHLTRAFDTITIEDLTVRGMLNIQLARAISDRAFREFRRRLGYKSEERGHRVVVADRWFASSNACHTCGRKHEDVRLSGLSWTCGTHRRPHDLDLNAAGNLAAYAASPAVSACGGKGSDVDPTLDVKRPHEAGSQHRSHPYVGTSTPSGTGDASDVRSSKRSEEWRFVS